VLILISYLALTFGFSLITPRSHQSSRTASEHQCCCCTADRCATGGCCCSTDEGDDGERPRVKVRWVVPVIDQKCRGETPSVLPQLEPSISVLVAAPPRFDIVECGAVATVSVHFRSHTETPPGPPPRA
jgi:hypothetical protein